MHDQDLADPQAVGERTLASAEPGSSTRASAGAQVAAAMRGVDLAKAGQRCRTEQSHSGRARPATIGAPRREWPRSRLRILLDSGGAMIQNRIGA